MYAEAYNMRRTVRWRRILYGRGVIKKFVQLILPYNVRQSVYGYAVTYIIRHKSACLAYIYAI